MLLRSYNSKKTIAAWKLDKYDKNLMVKLLRVHEVLTPDTNTKVTTDVSKQPKSGEASALAPKEPRWYHPYSVGYFLAF